MLVLVRYADLAKCSLLWFAGVFLSSVGYSQEERLREIAQVAFTEGPVWHKDGSVLFTDVANNRIMRRAPDGSLETFRSPSGRANGLVFDLQGRLVACEGGNRRVTRTELDGSLTVLVDQYGGHRLNSPNDVTVDSAGYLFFTDPRYGDRTGMELIDEDGRAVEGVYCIQPDGTVKRLISHIVTRPNGIALSPDERFLFVADNANDAAAKSRKLWRFELTEDRDLVPHSETVLFDWGDDRGPDGMAIDKQGRLYVTAGLNYAAPPHETAGQYKAAVYVISSSDGKLLRTIDVPIDMVTNCAFGGDDYRTLFVTAGHKLWQLRVDEPGHVVWLQQ